MPEIDFSSYPDQNEPSPLLDISGYPDQPKRGGVTRTWTDETAFTDAGKATNGNVEKRMRNASAIAATHDISERDAYEMHDVFTQHYGEANLWDKAVGSFKAGWGDMYSSFGGILKRNGVGEFADTYIDFGERLKRSYIPPEDQSQFTWRKMIDPEWYATTATRSVPFALSLIPAALVGGYAAASGGAAMGLGLYGQTVLGAMGGASLSRPIESAIEAQGAFEEATQKGFSPEDAEMAADQVFWDNMKLSGLDAAEFATAFLPMGKVAGATAKRILAKRVAAVTGKLGAVGVMEGAEERYQEKAVMDAMGDFTSFFDLNNPRLNEASAAGAVFGVGLGGAGSVYTVLSKNVKAGMPEELNAVYTEARENAIANGADPKAADLIGLDAVAGTPEGKAHIEKVMSNIKTIVDGGEIATAEGEEAFKLDLSIGQETELDEAAVDSLIDGLVDGEVNDKSLDDFMATAVKVLNNERGSININPMTSRKGTGDIPPKTTQQPEGGKEPEWYNFGREKRKEFHNPDAIRDAGNYQLWDHDESKWWTFRDREHESQFREKYPFAFLTEDPASPEKTWYRFGKPPQGNRSVNAAEQKGEQGVSVYATPGGNNPFFADRDVYSGPGRQVGWGSDGEPVIIPTGEWKKFHPNPSRPPEVGGQSILDKVKSINNSIGEKGSIDLEPLIDLGKSIWSEGHTTLEAFTTRAKELLSSSWEKVKDLISQAWESVKAFNEKLGEKGQVGFDITDELSNDSVRKAIENIKASGGLNLESISKDYGKEQILELTRKHQGLLSKNGAAKLDEIAQEFGFSDGDALLQSILSLKSKAKTKGGLGKQESAEIIKFSTLAKKGYEIISGSIASYELDLGDQLYIAGEEHTVTDIDDEGTITLKDGVSFRVGADESVSFEAIKRAEKESNEKENKALLRATRRKLAASAKVKSGIKARIRQATGQYTVSNLVREDAALKAGLMKAAQAAQVAMREGRKEGVAQEKARMKALIQEAKQREAARKAAQEIIDDIQKVRKRLNSLQPEAQAVLQPILDEIDFTNMSEEKRADLSQLRAFYESEQWAVPASKEKDFAKLDKKPIRDYTISDLQDLQALVKDAVKLSEGKDRERAKALKDIGRIAEMKGSIAVDYQKKITAILAGFDFKKPSDQKLTELRSLKDFIEKNGVPLGINQKYLNELDRLGEIALKDMTTDDLVSLRDTLKHLQELGKLKASLKFKYNARKISEKIRDLVASTHNLDPKVKNLKDKSGRDKIRIMAKSAYLMTLHTPRVAEMIDGYKKGENLKLIKWLSREETKATKEAADKKVAFLNDLKSIGIEKITEEMEIRMMTVMREREGARSQVETLLKQYNLPGVPSLNDQEEAIVGKIKEYINAQKNELAATMEEITGEVFPEMETYYLPMKYEREENLIPDNNVQGGYRTTHTFDGFKHARQAGVKKVPRVDIVNIFSEALDEQLWYLRMQPVLEDIRQLVLSDEYGEAAGEMVQNWWRDELDIIARRGWSNSAKNTALSSGLRQIRHNLNQSILLFKLSTIMLQPFAVFDAVAYTNSKYGPAAAARVLEETTKTVFVPGVAKKYIEGSAELQMRQGGELAISEELAAASDDTLIDKASRLGYSMIRRADVNTAAGVQKAIEKMLIEQGADDAKTESEFIMNLTNGSSTIVQRPHILSTGEGARTWFTFQSFVLNRWGIIAHDLIMSGFVKSDSYKTKLLSLVSLGILMMAGNLEDDARKLLAKLTTGKEWKDKKRGEFANGVINLTSTMPVFGSMLNAAAMGMSSSPPVVRAGENLAGGLYRLYAGKDGESKVKGAMKATEASLELFVGLPGTAQAFDLLEGAMFENN